MIRRVSVASNRLPVSVFAILPWRIRRKWRVGQRGRPRRSGSSLGIVGAVALGRVLFENRHVSEWTDGSEVHLFRYRSTALQMRIAARRLPNTSKKPTELWCVIHAPLGLQNSSVQDVHSIKNAVLPQQASALKIEISTKAELDLSIRVQY